MTFAHDFAFYRDDRRPGGSPPDTFWAAMKAEAAQIHAQRLSTFPDRVAKGRMARADADRELRIARAIAEDWGALEHSPGFPLATWSEIIHSLRREITMRRQRWPQLVEARRLTAEEADRRLLTLEMCHDVLWHSPRLPDALAAHRDAERERHRQAA